MKLNDIFRRLADILPASARSVEAIRREISQLSHQNELISKALEIYSNRDFEALREHATLSSNQHESIAKAVEIFANRDFGAIETLKAKCDSLEELTTLLMVSLRRVHGHTAFLVDSGLAGNNLAAQADGLLRSLREMTALPREGALVVAFITTPNYLPATRCAIASLFRHRRPGVRYDVRVVAPDLAPEDASSLAVFGDLVTVLSPDASAYDGFSTSGSYVAPMALFKFDLPNLLPDCDRLLYLDSDILVLDDISGLWDTDLSGSYAAVVKDYAGTVRERHHEKMGHASYFNSGVMLLDLAHLREAGMRDMLIEAKRCKDFPQHFMDQDAFNLAFKEKVVFLPPEYNMMFANNQPPFGGCQPPNEFYGLSLPEYTRREARPKILHLTNWAKPWDTAKSDFYEKWYQENAILAKAEQMSAQGKGNASR